MPQTKIKVLLIDTDPYARSLLADHLVDDNIMLDFKDDPALVLESLHKRPDHYDVLIIDLDLSEEQSGLDCLRTIKADERFLHLPIIIKTDNHNITFVSEALAAGAYYFLDKSTDKKIVRSLVISAKSHKEQNEHNDFKHAQARLGMKFTEAARFVIRTLDDAQKLANLLSCSFPDPDRVYLGIHELLTNAIEHGNLALDYHQKSELLATGQWQSEIDRRQNLPENIKKTVDVKLMRGKDKLELFITDKGKGFRSNDYLEIDPCRIFDAHGRGIAMAKKLSFDELEYIGCGNKVRAAVKI
ncbi:response regulator [Terasakiella sp. SH-1]|uniref:response regulator n=1 Tax=Terasakiella sp. SH-1 TaxID=2560057 RepID=UPI0010737F33|nr:response regulator [Terasakiella sp. SH-1]